jgi:FAD/FMN-containing dehydrogenase/uncharacterized membrane protein YhaH (DUF805 family)
MGRINRGTYWIVSVFIWSSFYVLFNILNMVVSYGATWVLYPILFWTLTATAIKRLHDSNKTGWLLLLVAIPLIGPLILFFLLGFKSGNKEFNRFGAAPGSAPDYFKNDDPEAIPHLNTGERIVNDVTRINPVIVARVEAPATIEELQAIVANADKAVCIGGGRFSMGGQTASPNAIHIDMRKLNQVIAFSEKDKTIKVQAGIRWCDIQHYIDRYSLSVKIMQTYANFTVGGAISVNCHGRYLGLGPVVLSVKSIEVVLANGELAYASPTENATLFYACIGCYNAVAVIATVELELDDNIAVRRSCKKMSVGEYRSYFIEQVRNKEEIIFHNADIYPPRYKNIRAVSWTKTNSKPTVKTRLMPLAAAYPIERYFIGAFSKNDFGKWRREFIIDPLLFSLKKVHYKNYEAGYDVLELEPESRRTSTYVLQEYFVPVNEIDAFVSLMSAVFVRYHVNVINVSIRHALKDSGSLLAWAKEEVFAFVVWYKQGVTDEDKSKVGMWTRVLIDAAISLRGSYYLPYQPHATREQFFASYPRAKELFALKDKLDPEYKFRNLLWDKYYKTYRNEK